MNRSFRSCVSMTEKIIELSRGVVTAPAYGESGHAPIPWTGDGFRHQRRGEPSLTAVKTSDDSVVAKVLFGIGVAQRPEFSARDGLGKSEGVAAEEVDVPVSKGSVIRTPPIGSGS